MTKICKYRYQHRCREKKKAWERMRGGKGETPHIAGRRRGSARRKKGKTREAPKGCWAKNVHLHVGLKKPLENTPLKLALVKRPATRGVQRGAQHAARRKEKWTTEALTGACTHNPPTKNGAGKHPGKSTGGRRRRHKNGNAIALQEGE